MGHYRKLPPDGRTVPRGNAGRSRQGVREGRCVWDWGMRVMQDVWMEQDVWDEAGAAG